jgi:putative N6-adenine-specific DNA methylase
LAETLCFFAPCPRGLEGVLAAELRALGASVLDGGTAGVAFDGDVRLGMAANLHSRIASRVLQRVADGPYRNEDDLYQLARDVPWESWHAPGDTLRVDTQASGSPLRSLQFATLRVKDGLCDRLRERTGERPSIDRLRPQRRVFAFLDATRCTLYLDWSGEALFRRGWRRDSGEAPLKENLAAGLLALAGWAPGTPLLDPFCGAGTIVVEAAQQAAGIPPGAARRFAFERFLGFDRNAWQRLRAAPARPAPATPAVFGSDVSAAAVAAARTHLNRAGVPLGWVDLRQLDVLHLARAPAAAGLLLSNPPYGERLDLKGRQSLADADRFWPAFASVLKHHFAGWSACLFTSDLDLPQRLRLKPARRTPLHNGALDCRLFRFEMVAGSARGPRRVDAPVRESPGAPSPGAGPAG